MQFEAASASSALIVATGAISVTFSAPLTGLTHEVTSGISVEKILAEVPAASNGGGSKGSVTSAVTPTTTEMLASTSTKLLRSAFLGLVFSSVLVLLLDSSRLH